jgi:hypothetical protein
MTKPKPKYPMPDAEWEALLFKVIDAKYSDEESDEACECIEKIRLERTELVRRLERKKA